MVSGSIYFLGRYRPAHFEADEIRQCARLMMSAARTIDDDNLRGWILARIYELHGKIRRDVNCSAIATDNCDRGVSLAKRAHGPFLDAGTRDMPACPGLDYSRTVNV